MPKVKKSNNKFYVLIPQEIVDSLKMKEGEELEFSTRDQGSFTVSRKGAVSQQYTPAPELNEKELAVLRILDTMRYSERTKDKVESILNPQEKAVLNKLVERKSVTLYRKDPKEPYRYGIAKSVYERFLMGTRQRPAQNTEPAPIPVIAPTPQRIAPSAPIRQPERRLDRAAVKKWEERAEGGYIEELETKGFVVLRNEAEAASASAGLEDSIRQGLVVGTRAFDKKFYIGLRGFINKNGPKIMKVLERGKSISADEIGQEVGIEADAVKTVLYILADKGDITEVRRDIFRLA